jgi:N4-gp56 family major capsid protein
LQDISRDLLGKHAIMLNQTLKSGPMFGMQSVAASWPVYTHTDMEKTYENLTGFTKIQDYGGRELLDPEYEIGAIGRFRIIVNPILTYIPAGGAAGSTYKGDGTNYHVYPQIVVGRGMGGGDAFGQVPLRGFESINVKHHPVSEDSKADPLGQRGYVAAMTWQAQKVLNDDWMAVYYTCTEA